MIRIVVGAFIAVATMAQDLPRPRPFQSPGASLHGEFEISGTIVNSVTNEPIKRAIVQVIGGASRWVLADLTGSFRISNLPQGEYRIIANKPGFHRTASREAPITTIGPSREQLVLRLDPLAVIRGKVRDSYGEPVEGVLVQAYVSDILEGRRQIDWSKSSRTDDRGEYRLADLNPGSYIVRAAGRSGRLRMLIGQTMPAVDLHESFVPVYYDRAHDRASARMLTLRAGEQVSADFSLSLEPAYGITGELANFTSYRAIELDLLTENGEYTSGRKSVNANTGRFQIADVAPGSYVLRAKQGRGPDAMSAMKQIEVNRSDLENVRLELVPGTTISGKVTDEGERKNGQRTPSAEVTVSLTPADDLSDINDIDRSWISP